MSRRAMTWVWENSDTRNTDRLVLLYLAHREQSDGAGGGIANMAGLAAACRIPRSTAERVVDYLTSIEAIDVGTTDGDLFQYTVRRG